MTDEQLLREALEALTDIEILDRPGGYKLSIYSEPIRVITDIELYANMTTSSSVATFSGWRKRRKHTIAKLEERLLNE